MVAGIKTTRPFPPTDAASRSASGPGVKSSPTPAPKAWRSDFLAAFWPSLLSGVLLWLAFPPVNWTPLAWMAPIGWLHIILRKQPPGRGGYWGLWVAASLHWLAILEGIRRPYWALHFGWAALSLYLAFYIVLFVGSSRVLVHRWRWPVWIAAPMSWIGWELARGHLITGFSGAILGHSQVRWTQLIQIADLGGAYAVSCVVMTVAACLAIAVHRQTVKASIQAGSIAVLIVAAALGYGYVRGQATPSKQQPVKVALLQGTYNTVFERNRERTRKMFEQYLRLVKLAALEQPDLDLIVWPESTFTEFLPMLVKEGKNTSGEPSKFDPERVATLQEDFDRKCRVISGWVQHPADDAHKRHIHQLVGVEVVDVGAQPEAMYNSCLLLDTSGRVVDRYSKTHLVMFGEYIPILDWFPQLYRLTPMSGGTARGPGPKAFEVAGLRFSPNICFETVVPHLVRKHVNRLTDAGKPPDVLVNITHDGWFWGTAILDLQQACSIFRAVENRRPVLVAANPGLTTWVDGSGRVVAELPREQEDYLVASVVPDGRKSPYQTLGDWPMAICLGVAIAAMISGWRPSRGTV